MLGYPVAGPDNDLRPGHRRYNFVWYRPASEERELPRLLTDDSGRTHALSIPPPLIARDGRGARCARRRTQVLAPQFNEMVGAVRAAVPAADLRSRSAAHGVRPRRARSAMRRSWRARMSARASPRRPRMRWRSPMRSTRSDDVEAALKQFEAARLAVGDKHHRARAPSRRLCAGGPQDRGRARLRGAAPHARGGAEPKPR